VNAGNDQADQLRDFKALQSFRAPRRQLSEKRRADVLCDCPNPSILNPEWARLSKGDHRQRWCRLHQKAEGRLRSTPCSSKAIVDQTMKQQAAFQANFDKQEVAFPSSAASTTVIYGMGGKRSRCRTIGRCDSRRRHATIPTGVRRNSPQSRPVSLHRRFR